MSSGPRGPGGRKWLLRTLKLAVVALVAWFLIHTVRRAWGDLADHAWRFDFFWLVAAGALYLAGLLPAALFWHRVLLGLGQRPKLVATLRAYFIGHLGKYVPGKAMVVVLRAGLLRGRGVELPVAAASVFYETLTMMAVGAFLAAAILVVGFRDQLWLAGAAAALMAVSALPTLPPIFRRLARLAGVGRNDEQLAARLNALGYRQLAVGWLAMALGWSLMGLSLWATLEGMGVEPEFHASEIHLALAWPLYVAAVALAMVAGFLSLIPGGALVRETVLVILLAQVGLSEAQALIAAVLLRLVWLAAEVLVSLALWRVCPS